MRTIAIVNEKGGTGKTTTAVNLSAAIGELGHKVLLVDLDGQAASSRWVGIEDDARFADALWRGTGLEPVPDVMPNVSLAPGHGKLDAVAHDLRPTQGGQLRKLLSELHQFDYVLIDCPPSLGNRLIGNALLASTHAVVPVECSILAMDGLKILLTTLDDVREGFDHKIELAGVVACRFDSRTRLSHLVLEELRRALPGKVFQTVIRENIRMRECPASGESILTYAGDSHAAEDYRSLAREFIAMYGADAQAEQNAATGPLAAPDGWSNIGPLLRRQGRKAGQADGSEQPQAQESAEDTSEHPFADMSPATVAHSEPMAQNEPAAQHEPQIDAPAAEAEQPAPVEQAQAAEQSAEASAGLNAPAEPVVAEAAAVEAAPVEAVAPQSTIEQALAPEPPRPKTVAEAELVLSDRNIDALRLAIDDFVRTHDDLYPRGHEYQVRLNNLRKTLADARLADRLQALPQLAEDLLTLRREAMCDNPLMKPQPQPTAEPVAAAETVPQAEPAKGDGKSLIERMAECDQAAAATVDQKADSPWATPDRMPDATAAAAAVEAAPAAASADEMEFLAPAPAVADAAPAEKLPAEPAIDPATGDKPSLVEQLASDPLQFQWPDVTAEQQAKPKAADGEYPELRAKLKELLNSPKPQAQPTPPTPPVGQLNQKAPVWRRVINNLTKK